jgi:hypothetical protein
MPTLHRPAALRYPCPAGARPWPWARAARLTAWTVLVSAALTLAPGAPAAPAAPAAPEVTSGPVGAGVRGAAPAAPPSPTVTGVLERVVVETDDETGRRTAARVPTAWLRTATGRIPIDADAVRGVPTGSILAVRLTAPQVGSEATRPRGVASVTVLSRASSTPPTSRTAAVHSVTVVLALPAGTAANRVTATALSRVVSTDVARFWSRETDGRITFTVAKAVGWTRLSSSCHDIWSVWDEVRGRVGFTPGPRRHLLVYAPSGTGCPTGLATVGSTPDAGGNAIVGGATASLVAHELGHNLGLGHSEALTCPEATDGARVGDGFGSGCRRVPYGDWYDVMGISWESLGSLSTAHAYRLGLLASSAVVTARDRPARVTLRPVSTRAGVRSLRIQDPAGATYVVEYRPASGADAWLGTGADWRGLRPGVLLRRIDPEDPGSTLLLDPTPPGGSGGEDVDVVLPSGRVVTMASGRVSVMVESVAPVAVTVAVAVDGAWPALVVQPRGRLVDGRQVTIDAALAAWGALAS